MQLYQKKLLFITVCVLLGCSANGQKKGILTPYQTTTNIQNHVLSTESLINELKGCWHPILYTISDVYARDTNEVEKLMQKDICIGSDTAVIFTDTIFSIKINHVEQSSKVDWIFHNIDPDKRAVYNILGSKIWDITLDCSMKSTPNSVSTFRTTANFAYDGKYLYYGEDGFNFLLIKDSSNVKKYFGSGSSVK